MKMQATIQKWGNSLALRLTGPIRTIPKFEVNMVVDVDVEKDSIKVQPAAPFVKKFPFKEKDLLKDLDANTAHAEILAKPNTKEMGE